MPDRPVTLRLSVSATLSTVLFYDSSVACHPSLAHENGCAFLCLSFTSVLYASTMLVIEYVDDHSVSRENSALSPS